MWYVYPIVAAILPLIMMWLINSTRKKDIVDSETGLKRLRYGAPFWAFGAVLGIIVPALLLTGAHRSPPSTTSDRNAFLWLIFTPGILGWLLLLMCIRFEVKFSGRGLTIQRIFSRVQVLKWNDIEKITYSTTWGSLSLHDRTGRAYSMMVFISGFREFEHEIRQKIPHEICGAALDRANKYLASGGLRS